MTTDPDDVRRRSFLQWASSVGLSAVAPGTVAAVAGADECPEDVRSEDVHLEPTAAERDGDVSVTHPLEYQGVRDRVAAAHEHDDYTEKYSRRLQTWMDRWKGAAGAASSLDLHVRTVGESATVVTERYGRQYDGWTATSGEVDTLQCYGEYTYAPEFLSTKVTVLDVSVDEISDLAAEDRVLTVGLHPSESGRTLDSDLGDEPVEREHTDQDYHAFDAADLPNDDLLGFERVDEADTLTDGQVKIGIVDRGYEAEPRFWEESHAAPHIDESLAAEFASDWNDVNDYHGKVVANTVAYCLGDGWDDMIVPMKYDADRFDTDVPGTRHAEGIRAAIEFAARHDIEVLNLSNGPEGAVRQHCQSAFCDELAAYSAAGNVAVASVSNDGEGRATEPAASLFDVGVGGVHDRECSDGGYWIDQDCSLSDPSRYDDARQCEVCASREPDGRFVPDVFGVMTYGGEGAQDRINGGTSYAAPQFTAAAALLKANGAADVWEVKEIARGQSVTNVCPDDHAKAGQLFHANRMLTWLPPTRPADLTVEWVSDTSVALSWDPANSPGIPDVDRYRFFEYTTQGARTFSTEDTEIVLDDRFGPGSDVELKLQAYDEWGYTSEEQWIEFQTHDSLLAEIIGPADDVSAGDSAFLYCRDLTDDGTELTGLEWTFDDGATDDGWYTQHTYDDPGTYWVRLEATDDEGETTTDAFELTVV